MPVEFTGPRRVMPTCEKTEAGSSEPPTARDVDHNRDPTHSTGRPDAGDGQVDVLRRRRGAHLHGYHRPDLQTPPHLPPPLLPRVAALRCTTLQLRRGALAHRSRRRVAAAAEMNAGQQAISGHLLHLRRARRKEHVLPLLRQHRMNGDALTRVTQHVGTKHHSPTQL